MTNCFLCGASTVYVGITNIKCRGAGCANYEAPPGPPKEKTYGSWEWARNKQNDEYKLEWRYVGGEEWQKLEEDLDDDLPDLGSEPYEYRLDQSFYEHETPHPRGSWKWACEQDYYNRLIKERSKGDWEIVGMR